MTYLPALIIIGLHGGTLLALGRSASLDFLPDHTSQHTPLTFSHTDQNHWGKWEFTVGFWGSYPVGDVLPFFSLP